jgi:hypothetical protein
MDKVLIKAPAKQAFNGGDNVVVKIQNDYQQNKGGKFK